jgi:hypothetical protein
MGKRVSKEEKKKIKDVISHFHFPRVHKILWKMDWKWFMGEEGMQVPSVQMLKTKAKELLMRLATDPKKTKVGANGFIATKRVSNTGNTIYTLRFQIDEYSSFSR